MPAKVKRTIAFMCTLAILLSAAFIFYLMNMKLVNETIINLIPQRTISLQEGTYVRPFSKNSLIINISDKDTQVTLADVSKDELTADDTLFSFTNYSNVTLKPNDKVWLEKYDDTDTYYIWLVTPNVEVNADTDTLNGLILANKINEYNNDNNIYSNLMYQTFQNEIKINK